MSVWDITLEPHEVQTEDGYILSLFRIPQYPQFAGDCSNNSNLNCTDKDEAKVKQQTSQPSREAVLLVHGLNAGGTDWLLNSPEKCLPNVLVNSNFDPWICCLRGTRESQRHVKLNTNSSEYWDFSIEDHAQYDLPAVINYILKVTGKTSLFYIGHSLGCAIFFMNSFLKPEERTKVKAMIALAPPFYGKHNGTFLVKLGVPFIKLLGKSKYLYRREICSKPAVEYFKWIPFINPNNFAAWCVRLFATRTGHIGTNQLDQDRLKIIVNSTPSPTSLKVLSQTTECIMSSSGQLQMFNYGLSENQKRYGQDQPPKIDLKEVTTPVATFSSKHDTLICLKGVVRISEELPNLICHKKIQVPGIAFSHSDFLFGKDAHELVYKDVVQILQEFSTK